MEKDFLFASSNDVKNGLTTDVYFKRTLKILREKGFDNVVVNAEFTPSSLPKDYRWSIFAGLREVLKLLEGKEIDVYSLLEGTFFTERDYFGYKVPVMRIVGPYSEFIIYETPILGFLAFASGIATKAARIKKAAGDKLVLSFGARRNHPAIAPTISFYAYVGGADAVSCIKGAELLGINATGTMPHSLMIIFKATLGDHTKAWLAFDEVVDKNVPRIVLIDTFWDETEEAIKAAELLKDKLWGIRLDTPSSRRGNFADIIREVRWKLKAIGLDDIKIVVSGGLNEYTIRELSDVNVDAFGVGSAIANAPLVDFAMDISAVKVKDKWKPIAKRGKLSGAKQLYRCKKCNVDVVALVDSKEPRCPICGRKMEPMLVKVMDKGKIIAGLESPETIKKRVKEQLENIEL